MRRDAVELLQAMFSEAPEALNAIDVMCAPRKLVLPVVDSVVLRVADINEAIVAAPPVRVDDCLRLDATANNSLQSSLRAVGDDLRLDTAFALQESEDRSLTCCTTTALTSNTASAEVVSINFNLAGKRRDSLALFGDTLTDFEKDHCHSFTSETSQLRDIGGRKIDRKVAQQLAEFTLGNSGTRIIAVSSFHSSSLA